MASPVLADDEDLMDLLDDEDYFEEEVLEENPDDPLEPLNRFFFGFNDKLYYWVSKPVAKVYSVILPEDLRICVDNGFHNLAMPVRLFNNVLQGKFMNGLVEVERFLINSTVGVVGLADPAATDFGLPRFDEDFGQTLGRYGMGQGPYLCLPLLGPSTVRDGSGLIVDYFVSPLRYALRNNFSTGLALLAWDVENAVSLHGEDYESLSEQAFDPYVAFRDFYLQHREALVEDHLEKGEQEQSQMVSEADCQGMGLSARAFNLAEARKQMACAEQRGQNVRLVHGRHGNRRHFAVVSQPGEMPRQAITKNIDDLPLD
ncbi:MAG: VacJ family lipoprotein [Thermodesulfobacteriota bacterium]